MRVGRSASRADLSKIIPSFTVYKFLQALSQPFTKFDAYKLGIIDAQGNFLKRSKELKKQKEKRAASMFFRIIINLKKLLMMIPNPSIKQRLKTLPTAMFLIKEEVEKVGGNGDDIERAFYEYVQEINPEMYEMMTSTGGGVAGMHQSVEPDVPAFLDSGREADRLAVPPRKKRKKRKIRRR
jgi:hypothetical protein